ncbi:hypothetical protein ARSEF4850_005038 [Beauveria asiatica]
MARSSVTRPREAALFTGSNTLSQPSHSMNSSVLLCLLPDGKGTPTQWCDASGGHFDGLGLALL